MAKCAKCGATISVNAKFCGRCGTKVMPAAQANKGHEEQPGNARKVQYDGAVHKCPNCGAVLSSFVENCPECSYELRGTLGAASVQEFAMCYTAADTNSKKIDLIRTFAIPNTKEDILEFAVLASSNIDTTAYTNGKVIISGGVSQQDLTEAWMAKFEQAYQKATILLSDSAEQKKIESLYLQKKHNLESARRKQSFSKKKRGIIMAVLGVFAAAMFTLSAASDFKLGGLMVPGAFAVLAVELIWISGMTKK